MSHEIRTPDEWRHRHVRPAAGNPTHRTSSAATWKPSTPAANPSLTIINDILDFSKIESGKLELEHQPFDLRACIEDALDLLPPRRRRRSSTSPTRWTTASRAQCVGDVTRLRQVLVNLLGNAVKFTAQGEVVVQRQTLLRAGRLERRRAAVPGTCISPCATPASASRRTGWRDSSSPFSQADASTTRHYGGTGLGPGHQQAPGGIDGRQDVGRKRAAAKVPRSISPCRFQRRARRAARHALEGQQPQLADLRLLIVDDNPTNCRILTLRRASGA